MDIEEADKIRLDYGHFLEHYANKFLVYFSGGVPESFLPYTKDKIIEAINIFADELAAEGQTEPAEVMRSSLSWLVMYMDDETALKNASKNFNNPTFLRTSIKVQKNLSK